MSGPFGSHNFMTKGAAPETGQSLRFNDDDSAYLSWTPSAAGNRKTWTWSAWVKRGNISALHYLFGNSNGSNQGFHVRFDSNDTLAFLNYPSSSSGYLNTSRVFRDVNAWYHIVLVWDTTNATSGDRMRIYINGERETAFGTASYPALNLDGTWNSTSYGEHSIGRSYYNAVVASNGYFDGYLSEVNFVDGTALDPTSFGETNANGQWVPIQNPSVTYGTNGFYLPFTNDYEVEGFNTVTYRGNGADQYIGGVGFEPDFLWVKDRTAAYNHLLVNSVTGVTNFLNSNTTNAESSTAGYITSTETDGFSLGSGGNVNASGNSYVAWAWDMGTVENLVTNGDFDQDISGWSTTQGTVTWDSGRRAYLQGPSGVTFRQTITGLDVSKTYYYTASLSRTSGTGNFGVDVDGTLDYVAGSSYTNYTASGFFTPSSSSIVFDVWGGSGLYLYADDIQIFEANTDGSITSSVKANPTYGQSIVGYNSGASGDKTVGHGLSSAPELIITKSRDSATYNWSAYHADVIDTTTKFLRFNTTDAIITAGSSIWGSALPTSSVFGITSGNGVVANTDCIAYCFHSVAGYSSFGSYTGNGSSAGPTVTTGFAPAFVMIKRTDSAADWQMYDNVRDTTNPITVTLAANKADAESTFASGYDIDFNSTGFQIVTGPSTAINASGGTYIYMAFADKREAAFWLDQSGNNNDWTNNNMQESDISLDSPTNNFATLNPLDRYPSTYLTLSEGNLLVNGGPTTGYTNIGSTFYQSTGKWYVEFIQKSRAASTWTACGLLEADVNHNGYLGQYTGTYAYLDNGGFYYGGSSVSTGTSYAVGDVIAYAVDFDAGEIKMYKNNTLVYTFSSLTTGVEYAFGGFGYSSSDSSVINFGQDSSFAGNKVAQGNTDENGFGDFYYEPPAGYLALCTQNLPDPAILDGSDHFNTVLYTGNGSTQSITGVGFQPDWTWIKERPTSSAYGIYDVVRGNSKALSSNQTSAEWDQSSDLGLESFDTDGFTVDYPNAGNYYINRSSQPYVAWNWKAGGTGVANTDGSISSTVSANPTAGFSIVGYTGNGTAGATIGHGLSSEPEMIITKNRDALTNWFTFVSELGAGNSLILNTTNASYAASILWNNTAPTASVFSVGTATETNGSGNDIIAYCFHSVEGYSKIGSFTGNGSTDGTFVYTGFKPAFILWKRSSSTSNWLIWDNTRSPYNVVDDVVFPDLSNAESSSAASYGIDMLSNGFKLRNSNATVNGSGSTYIYMAFAEIPFKYSNAR